MNRNHGSRAAKTATGNHGATSPRHRRTRTGQEQQQHQQQEICWVFCAARLVTPEQLPGPSLLRLSIGTPHSFVIASFTFAGGTGWTRRASDGLYEQVTENQAVHTARLRRKHRHLPVTATWKDRRRTITTRLPGDLGHFLDHMPACRHLTLQLVVNSSEATLSWAPPQDENPKTETVPEDDRIQDEDVLARSDDRGEPDYDLIHKQNPGYGEQCGARSSPGSQCSSTKEGNDLHESPEDSCGSDNDVSSDSLQGLDNKAPSDDALSDSLEAGIVQTEELQDNEDKVEAEESFRKIETPVPLSEENILRVPLSSGDAWTSRDDELDEAEMQVNTQGDTSSRCPEKEQLPRQDTEAATTPPATATAAPVEAPAPETATQEGHAAPQESTISFESHCCRGRPDDTQDTIMGAMRRPLWTLYLLLLVLWLLLMLSLVLVMVLRLVLDEEGPSSWLWGCTAKGRQK